MIKITTLITTYNHEKYIEQAINSVLAQKGDFEHEIIILDDCSKDCNFEIISKFASQYSNIKAISNKKNLGISENMKQGFLMAQGKYIAILEGDDFWTDKYKLEKQMRFLEENADCSMVFSKVQFFADKSDNLNYNNIAESRNQDRYKEKMQPQDWLSVQSYIGCVYNFSCCMFRTEYMKNLPESLYEGHFTDVGFVYYLAKLGNIGFIKTPLSLYRIHSGGFYAGANLKNKLKYRILCVRQALSVCEKQYEDVLKKDLKTCKKELLAENCFLIKIWFKLVKTINFYSITR